MKHNIIKKQKKTQQSKLPFIELQTEEDEEIELLAWLILESFEAGYNNRHLPVPEKLHKFFNKKFIQEQNETSKR